MLGRLVHCTTSYFSACYFYYLESLVFDVIGVVSLIAMLAWMPACSFIICQINLITNLSFSCPQAISLFSAYVILNYCQVWLNVPHRASPGVVYIPRHHGAANFLHLADSVDIFTVAHKYSLKVAIIRLWRWSHGHASNVWWNVEFGM